MADFLKQLNHQDQEISTASPSLSPMLNYHPSSVGAKEQLLEDVDKKRGMNKEQFRMLERCFMLEKKLLPERKMYLAQVLGLPPRQIAVWFQNRRARWKTKQLEKEYEFLKRRFDALMVEQDALKAQNQRLHSMLLSLRIWQQQQKGSINLKKEIEAFRDSSKHMEAVSQVGTFDQNRAFFQRTEAFPLQLQIQGMKMDHIDEGSSFCNNFFSIDVEGGLMTLLDQAN